MPRSLVNLVDEIGLESRVNTLEGAASTVKNYIPNAVFNSNTPPVAGWSLFNTTIDSTTKIPTGSVVAGAAGFNTLATTATTPLSGLYSLLVSTPAGVTITTTGFGFISNAFTIDREDAAKVLGFSFAYEAILGTMNFSGTSANTWAVYIRDVSGGTWIQPAGVYNLVQSSGTGFCSGTFQTTATGTQYQIAVMMINTVSSAVSMEFDSFQLGPQKAVYGSPVTDWQSYTPTLGGVGTAIGVSFKYRRVGDTIQVTGLFATGTPTAAQFTISLPNAIDATKIGGTAATVGNLTRGSTSFQASSIIVRTDLSTSVVYSGGQYTAAQLGLTPQNGNSLFPSGETVSVEFFYPAAGLSSSVQMSNDTDTRVVAARYTNSTNQACPTLGALTFDTRVFDTHNAFSVTNYTVPISGIYEIKFYGASTGSPFGVATQAHPIYLGIDGGVAQAFAAYVANAGGTTYEVLSGSTITQVRAGQTLQIIAATNGIPYTLTNLQVEFKRLSGPSAIAASETVAMRAYKTSGSHTSTGNNQTVASWNSSPFDTHGAFNVTTGEYTVPVSGTYLVAGMIGFSPNATGVRALQIEVDLSRRFGGSIRIADGGNVNTLNFSGLITATAGQKITVSTFQNSGGNLNYDTTSNYSILSIVRVGN